MSRDYQDGIPKPLSKDDRRRLEKLRDEWGKETSAMFLEKFTLPDLRLLLENFEPIQDLIRQIATGSAPEVTRRPESPNHYATPSAATSPELMQLRRQLDEAQQQRRTAEARAQQLQHELDNARQEMERFRRQPSVSSPVLAYLRQDAALAERLGLEALLQDGAQALIRCVSVLSQLPGMERVWEVLKERCERDRRPAGPEEQAVLAAAVEWHNHNWRKKPYALIQPAAGESFNFNQQQRSASVPSGESITACWLPGIADGNGKPVRKALVVTR